MIRRLLALLATGATVAAGLMALQSIAPEPEQAGIEAASAVTGADFKAGNIISDEKFYDGAALSAPDVQSFLVSKNGSTAPTALRNYAQQTPTMPADRYCATYQGSPYESVADIITKVGQACNISQKALLVLLEKEQSLISMQSPSLGRLAAATGFGCPDTAPCDPNVAGFFYQVYYGARQFQVYKANVYEFNHIPFATNNVLYHPNFSCGSSPVFIENYATAGLYNYTPYQPNAAALNNLGGEGDGCSAYGNRNFWWLYSNWFGSTGGSNEQAKPTLIQAEGRSELFLLSSGTRYYIPDAFRARYEAAFGKVTTIPAQGMDWIPWGPWAQEFLLGADDAAFLITPEGKLYQFRNRNVFADFGGKLDQAPSITKDQAAKAPQAGILESFVRTTSGHLLLIQSGTQREVSNLDILTQMGFFTATTPNFPDALLANLPYGAPIVTRGGVVAGGEGRPAVFIDGESNGHEVPAALAKLDYLATTSTFTAGAYDAITKGQALAPLMTDGTTSGIITTEGLLTVSPAQYGGGVTFQQQSTSALSALKSAGAALGAHFVQQQGDSDIQLIAGGERKSFADQKAVTAEATKRGISDKVYTTVAGAISGVTVGNGITNGSVLKPQGSEQLYVLDGMHLQPVANLEIAQALGFTQPVITITQASFENIAKRDGTISGTQLEVNGTSGFAAGGAFHPYVNAKVQADYGLANQTLSPELTGLVNVSSTPASDFLKGPDGSVYWISGGEKRPVGWPQIVTDMGGYDRMLEASDAVLAQLRTGAYLYGAPEGYTAPTATPVTTPPATTTPAPTATATPTATPIVTPAPSTPAATTPAATTPAASAPAETTPVATAPVTTAPTATPTPTEEPITPLTNGMVVTDPSGNGVYLVNGGELLQLGSQRIAQDLGLPFAAAQVVSDASLQAFTGPVRPLYSTAVRCGDTDYLGIGGELLAFDSAETKAAYGLTHVTLDPAICATLKIGDEKVGTTVLAPNGNTYVVEAGALRAVDRVGFTATPTATADPSASATPDATATSTPDVTTMGTSTATPDATATATAPATPAVTLPVEIISALKRAS